MNQCDVAVIGSGFAGSLMARVLAVLGYDVVLLDRGTHPRFAIGESSTPLANLSLERLGIRYGLADCYRLATYGRWCEHLPRLRRGLKRGFTYYRHHPGQSFENRGVRSERLLVAASPEDSVADTHWLRADVDAHFVGAAQDAGVDYRDQAALSTAVFEPDGVRLSGSRLAVPFTLHAQFVIDATGPGGFLARQLSIPSVVDRTRTRSSIVYSHFTGVHAIPDVVRGLPDGPYPDHLAAVHHLIDEGWMYSLGFDDGVTSAGVLLTPRGLASLGVSGTVDANALWDALLARYPSIASAYAGAKPILPIAFRPTIQHRLARASGERWAMLPHAFAFVDPLYSTGIAWSLRAVERLGLAFEEGKSTRRIPDAPTLERYDRLLREEADQIDMLVAGAYASMAHFDLFAAHAMLYFATVSYAEVSQRLGSDPAVAWKGFLGIDDPVLAPLMRDGLRRLKEITHDCGAQGTRAARDAFAGWVARAIAPRNIAGLAHAGRNNLYPVDFDTLVDRHALLDLTRDQLMAALPALRGMSPEPSFSR